MSGQKHIAVVDPFGPGGLKTNRLGEKWEKQEEGNKQGQENLSGRQLHRQIISEQSNAYKRKNQGQQTLIFCPVTKTELLILRVMLMG